MAQPTRIEIILLWSFWWLIWSSPSRIVGAHSISSCNVEFHSELTKNGIFASPNYPKPYPPKTFCRFDFRGRGKERIQVNLTDFDFPKTSYIGKNCEGTDAIFAYVEINNKLEQIDAICANAHLRPIMSSSQRLILELRGVLASRNYRGFNASYSFTERFGIHSGQQEPSYPCAFAYNSNKTMNGTFTSPNYPGYYPRNTECHYFFKGNPNERVHIHFSYFDLDGVMPQCDEITGSDYVDFSNFMTRDRKFLRHCGQLVDFDVESDGPFFRITFKSNDRLDSNGFNATYTFFKNEQFVTPMTQLKSVSHCFHPIAAGLLMPVVLITIFMYRE